ncbi:hypothetical protein GOP47_0010527 [Adiantum capillus-veneris]|uniref:Uncharacterized protein n=1 Tax=Adiantum capillus-veneris TaxID=13818 RepID=A0A9D4UVA5_ADICA|nr:hypothetical protein GOP47_0010527 [Adiantum capillus-veneris]
MDVASACWVGAADACRRGGKELGSIVLSLPSILFYQQRSSQNSPILTHRYVVGLFAFLISVDLVEIVGILCYQLFTISYFPWHLYPLMLNRAAELLSLLCAQGQILTAFSIAQVCLSLVSLTIFSKKQPCGRTNCIGPLIMYGILLSYEIFVTVVVMKLSKMPITDHEGQPTSNWPPHATSTNGRNSLLIGISRREYGSRVHDVPEDVISNPSRSTLQKMIDTNEQDMDSMVILAVEQPDGQKIAIAKICKEIKFASNLRSSPSHENGSSIVQDLIGHNLGNTSNQETSLEIIEQHEKMEPSLNLSEQSYPS